MTGLGRIGGVYAALHAGHHVGDYWAQTEGQAQRKGREGWDGRLHCARHVAALTAVQAVLLGAAVAVSGERLPVRRVVAGLAFNAVSHYALDRRLYGIMPFLTRVTRNREFHAMGSGLATGAAHLDQAAHVGCVMVAALIISRTGDPS